MLESRVYKKWQTSARDREIQSKIWSLAVYLGELIAVPGNVMKHKSYYATMAQTTIQVKTASLFFNIVLQIKIFKTGTRGVNI